MKLWVVWKIWKTLKISQGGAKNFGLSCLSSKETVKSEHFVFTRGVIKDEDQLCAKGQRHQTWCSSCRITTQCYTPQEGDDWGMLRGGKLLHETRSRQGMRRKKNVGKFKCKVNNTAVNQCADFGRGNSSLKSFGQRSSNIASSCLRGELLEVKQNKIWVKSVRAAVYHRISFTVKWMWFHTSVMNQLKKLQFFNQETFLM